MRAFVIGNGPSLNLTPVDRLRGEFTLAMNRFDLLGTDWDPTWWIMADVRDEDGWWDWPSLLSRNSMFLFREQDRPTIKPHANGNVIFYPRCQHIGGDYIPRSWHLPMPCDYGGGISIALQTAVSLGRNPIYLIGCDLYQYRGPDQVDINHFDPGYSPYKRRKSTGEEINTPEAWQRTNERLVYCHQIAKESATEMDIRIYNATVGGALEVYPRVDIDEVLA